VGVEILAESGSSALSLREVARRAGVSHAAPYRHFADHQALLAAIAADGFTLLRGMIAQPAPAPSPRAALRAALHAYLDFARRYPHHLDLMFSMDLSGTSADLKRLAEGTFEHLADLVSQAAIHPDPKVYRPLALALWAQVHGLAQLARVLQLQVLSEGMDSVGAAETALDALIDRLLEPNT
jgi:AcrR family transcriptional regulator